MVVETYYFYSLESFGKEELYLKDFICHNDSIEDILEYKLVVTGTEINLLPYFNDPDPNNGLITDITDRINNRYFLKLTIEKNINKDFLPIFRTGPDKDSSLSYYLLESPTFNRSFSPNYSEPLIISDLNITKQGVFFEISPYVPSLSRFSIGSDYFFIDGWQTGYEYYPIYLSLNRLANNKIYFEVKNSDGYTRDYFFIGIALNEKTNTGSYYSGINPEYLIIDTWFNRYKNGINTWSNLSQVYYDSGTIGILVDLENQTIGLRNSEGIEYDIINFENSFNTTEGCSLYFTKNTGSAIRMDLITEESELEYGLPPGYSLPLTLLINLNNQDKGLYFPITNYPKDIRVKPPMGLQYNQSLYLDDSVYAGEGYIKSTIKIDNGVELLPTLEKVLLFDLDHRRFLRATVSDSLSGEFEFKYLAMDRPYLLYALDGTNNYKLASTGPIYAKPMPRD